MFAYIVEQDYVQTIDCITKLLNDDKCNLSCATYELLINENINYEGHVIRYLKSQCYIDNLPTGSVSLGNLEKVGWVVLECEYAITANSKEQNSFYDLNNRIFLNEYRWNKIHNTNLLMKINMNKDFSKYGYSK